MDGPVVPSDSRAIRVLPIAFFFPVWENAGPGSGLELERKRGIVMTPSSLPLDVAAASFPGGEHRRLDRNNQDSFAVRFRDDLLVAAVADGCSSAPFSEAGAILGVRLFADLLIDDRSRRPFDSPDENLERVRRELLRRLRLLAGDDGEGVDRIASEALLFTLVGLLATPERLLLFALGDGEIVANGLRSSLRFPGEAPPYLGHELLGAAGAAPPVPFRIVADLPREDLRWAAIGSDGLADLLAAAGRSCGAGREPVPSLEELAGDERLFRNPRFLERKLRLAGQAGFLPDDTTLVVVRTRAPEE
jgi:hypothetical protein